MATTLATILSQEEDKLLACIHCGLCLEACPTYVETGDENDGPRGRLYLMRAVGEGRLAPDSHSFERHIDRCLGCRACEQVCPAGVEYGELLEAARGELFTNGPPRGFHYAALRFVLKHVWLHPKRLRLMLGFTRMMRDSGVASLLLKTRIPSLVSKRLAFGLALLSSSTNQLFHQGEDERAGPPTSEKGRISDLRCATSDSAALFTSCIGSALFARVNDATTRVLSANGFTVNAPDGQVCCGALHAHAGDLEGARTLARENIDAFGADSNSPVITNAGGCGAMLVSYAHLLANDEKYADAARGFSARVRDVSQQLEPLSTAAGAQLDQTVTYDASCHLLYGQHTGEAPLKMLAASGVGFAKLNGSERCCGAAGVYNLLEHDLSQRVLDEKLRNVEATGANILATGNPGCQMHIAAGARLAGMNLKVCHPVELLDESYRRAGRYEGAE